MTINQPYDDIPPNVDQSLDLLLAAWAEHNRLQPDKAERIKAAVLEQGETTDNDVVFGYEWWRQVIGFFPPNSASSEPQSAVANVLAYGFMPGDGADDNDCVPYLRLV